jgi:hypothetical protein
MYTSLDCRSPTVHPFPAPSCALYCLYAPGHIKYSLSSQPAPVLSVHSRCLAIVHCYERAHQVLVVKRAERDSECLLTCFMILMNIFVMCRTSTSCLSPNLLHIHKLSNAPAVSNLVPAVPEAAATSHSIHTMRLFVRTRTHQVFCHLDQRQY